MQRLGAKEILKSAKKVCTTWKNACLNHACGDEHELDLMCCSAVDRSQGQLIDLRIPDFLGGYELLECVVADR